MQKPRNVVPFLLAWPTHGNLLGRCLNIISVGKTFVILTSLDVALKVLEYVVDTYNQLTSSKVTLNNVSGAHAIS